MIACANGFDLISDGFIVTRPLVDAERVRQLARQTAVGGAGEAARQRNARMYAVRNLLSLVPEVCELASSPAVRSIVEPVLGPDARCVRGIFFDKSPHANWKVAWHQDLSIAVKRRVDVRGFGPWSTKAGVQHVQPPLGILERMLTVRLHLDDCGIDNGPLNVLPGSHAHGVLDPESVRTWRERHDPVPCVAAAGAAVVMRPLLLHASSTATRPRHRRVIHLEFGAGDLPGGLEWAVA